MRRHPYVLLTRARMKEFLREPEVVFWVFVFPFLLAIGLGIAFRNKPPDEIIVGVVQADGADRVVAALAPAGGFRVETVAADDAARRLRLGKIALVVVPGPSYEYRCDPTRPASLPATRPRRMSVGLLQVATLLVFGRLVFKMVIQGSIASIALLALIGAFSFSGLGLLVASRTSKIETVSGLMNLVMLPMFVFSGIFFSADRFPDVIQP